MSLFNELKRRNVFRVGAAYLVVSWLLLQIMDTVGPIISLSDGFARGVLFLVVIGFPIVMAVSWVFELTPEGVQTQNEADASGNISSSKKLNAVVIGGLVMVIVLLVVDNYLLVEAPIAEPMNAEISQAIDTNEENSNIEIQQTGFNETNSIAVLPFTNLSNDPDQEYFSDGLTEELINTLSVVDDLLVTGRTSAFFFKGSEESPQQIAESLGVNHILQGTVRKSGNQLRISTTLMNADSGFNLWTETFDRELADIFAIQDEIAEAVTLALSVTLGAGVFNRPGMTRNLEAYDAWLQSLALPNISSPEVMQAKTDALERAVALDDEFALAWLALSTRVDPTVIADPSPENIESYRLKSLEARNKAEALAPDMRGLQETIDVSEFAPESLVDRDQQLADLVDQYGNLEASINITYALFLSQAGRLEDGLFYARRAYRLDPYNESALNVLFNLLAENRQYEEAREIVNKYLMLIDYLPGNAGWAELAFLARLEGDWAAAKEATSNLIATRDGQLQLLDYLDNGDLRGGREEIRRMLTNETNNMLLRTRALAVLAALMDDLQLALEAFPRDLPYPAQLGSNRMLWREFGDEVRTTQEYKVLVEELGLVNYWRTTGNWADYCRPLEGSDDFECF